MSSRFRPRILSLLLRNVMQEEKEAGGARIEKDTGGRGSGATKMKRERVLPPHSPAQLGVSPSRPRRPGCTPRAASGRPCGVTRLTQCAPMGVGNRSKEEVRGESLLGSYDIHAGGVPKPAQKLFAVLPRQTERPHVGHPQARD